MYTSSRRIRTSRIDARFAYMLVCLVSAPSFSCPEAWTTILEAEKAEIIAPAKTLSAIDARQGRCVQMTSEAAVTENTILSRDTGRKHGAILFRHSIPAPGRYAFWARLKWHCSCSKRLKIDTSSTTFSPSNGESEGVAEKNRILVSYAQPREWTWMKLGIGQFGEAGQHQLRVLPIGHMLQLDALAISDDLDYRPPGMSELEDGVYLEEIQEANWTRQGEDLEATEVGAHGWGNFRLDFVARLGAATIGGKYRVALCEQLDGSAYILDMDVQSDRKVSVAFGYRHGDEYTPLIPSVTLDAGSARANVTIAKTNSDFLIGLNGTEVVRLRDDRLPSGKTVLFKSRSSALDYAEIECCRLASWLEVFGGQESTWDTSGGTWKVVAEQGDDSPDGYMAHASDSAYSLPPWPVSDAFHMNVELKLLAGTAGTLLGLTEDGSYWGVLVGEGSNSDEGETIRVVRVDGDGTKTLWSAPIASETGQWNRMGLTVNPGYALIAWNGERLGLLHSTEWSAGLPVGLCLGNESAAVFGRIEINELPGFPKNQQLFEPRGDESSFAQWEVESGSGRLKGHPAELQIAPSPEHGDATLTLHRILMSDTRIALIASRRNTNSNGSRDSELLSRVEIPLPSLPGDTRIGLRFNPVDPARSTHTAWIDYPKMTHLTMTRDGEQIQSKLASRTLQSLWPAFFFEKRGARLRAGVEQGVSLEAGGSVSETPIPMRVSIVLESFDEHQLLRIAEIHLQDVATSLDQGR
jgi:hypothetical protein